MSSKSFGFIGGGRITRIFLKGFKNAGISIEKTIVSDVNIEALEKLKSDFPEICISGNDNKLPAKQDLVFLSLHPPVIAEQLKEIRNELNETSILVSLAPKFTIAKISELLGGFNRIVRIIPNAPSIINKGFNPVSFSNAIPVSEKTEFLSLLASLGECPEVSENKLEAYAVLTAMGPTYFWFQLNEIKKLAASFGLGEDEINCAIPEMMKGTIGMLFNSGMDYNEVINTIPVKPLAEEEEKIKNIFSEKLMEIHNKIKP